MMLTIVVGLTRLKSGKVMKMLTSNRAIVYSPVLIVITHTSQRQSGDLKFQFRPKVETTYFLDLFEWKLEQHERRAKETHKNDMKISLIEKAWNNEKVTRAVKPKEEVGREKSSERLRFKCGRRRRWLWWTRRNRTFSIDKESWAKFASSRQTNNNKMLEMFNNLLQSSAHFYTPFSPFSPHLLEIFEVFRSLAFFFVRFFFPLRLFNSQQTT